MTYVLIITLTLSAMWVFGFVAQLVQGLFYRKVSKQFIADSFNDGALYTVYLLYLLGRGLVNTLCYIGHFIKCLYWANKKLPMHEPRKQRNTAEESSYRLEQQNKHLRETF